MTKTTHLLSSALLLSFCLAVVMSIIFGWLYLIWWMPNWLAPQFGDAFGFAWVIFQISITFGFILAISIAIKPEVRHD